MEAQKTIAIAYNIHPYRVSKIFEITNGSISNTSEFLSWSENMHGRLLLALEQYLKDAKELDEIYYFLFDKTYSLFPNGTLAGLGGKVNVTEIDIWLPPMRISEDLMRERDFSYPTTVLDYAFVTHKPKKRPHIFDIFHTFSLSVWITIAFLFLALLLVHHIFFKRKFNVVETLFHIFSVLVKQGSTIATSSFGEKILVYSWILGCMILCLAYISVSLSFLSFPPVTKIKHLSDLALAVQKGDYQCMTYHRDGLVPYFLSRNETSLNVIATDILKNNLSDGYT